MWSGSEPNCTVQNWMSMHGRVKDGCGAVVAGAWVVCGGVMKTMQGISFWLWHGGWGPKASTWKDSDPNATVQYWISMHGKRGSSAMAGVVVVVVVVVVTVVVVGLFGLETHSAIPWW